MVRILHMKWRGYCTSNGEATAHEVERLVHITCTDYYTSSGKDVKTAVPVNFQILFGFSEITQNYTA
jgi:hypothetical protein